MNSLKKILLTIILLVVCSVLVVHGFIGYRATTCCFDSPGAIVMRQLRDKNNIIPIAILGSGPAGLSAAVYGARAMKHTVVLEGNKPGGLLSETTWVENWPGTKKALGPDLITNVKEQAQEFGAKFENDAVERVDFSQWPYVLYTESGKTLHALTVIIATGASPRLLDVPGEPEYWGQGVTTCAVCDAPFYKGEEVVVIGGGDSAAEEAMQLAPYAKKITILVRKGVMRAAKSMQELLKGYPHISISYNVEVKKILGNGMQVTGLELFNNKERRTYHMPIAGVFLAIGHVPNSQIFNNIIETDNNGYIMLQERTQQTSLPGVFAAGDIEDHQYRQAGVAAGSGIKAALDADRFLSEHGFNDEVAKKIEPRLFKGNPERKRVPVRHINRLKEFERELHESNVPLIVDFYAEYCPSCMQMVPIFESVAQDYRHSVKFIKVDAEDEDTTDLLEKYHIYKVPCLLIFDEGQLIARYNTIMGRKELREAIEKLMA